VRGMRKCYAIFRFLSEENKRHMAEVAAECGFEIGFFDTNEEASGKVSDAEVVYCNDAKLFGEMPELRWCHSASAGVGHFIGSGAFDSGKIALTNSSGSYGPVISEYAVMAALLLMRRMPEYFEAVERREWLQNLRIRSIKGSRIAIMGTGNIGQNAAKRFKALEAEKVVGFSRSGRPQPGFDETHTIDEFEAVMSSESFDVLLLCVPGTPESEGLLSRERIGCLSENTFVINVGRGTVVDQDALVDALNSGRIAGAAIDVMYPEPLPADHPLWTARNCIVTPHISGDMGLPYTVDRTVEIFCDNLRRFSRGEELTHLVDISAGY